jgi:hypothetical protein
MFLPLSTPVPPASLHFITITHARSSLHGSIGSNSTTLKMPVLVATLLSRQQEGKGQTGAVMKRTFVPQASRLGASS